MAAKGLPIGLSVLSFKQSPLLGACGLRFLLSYQGAMIKASAIRHSSMKAMTQRSSSILLHAQGSTLLRTDERTKLCTNDLRRTTLPTAFGVAHRESSNWHHEAATEDYEAIRIRNLKQKIEKDLHTRYGTWNLWRGPKPADEDATTVLMRLLPNDRMQLERLANEIDEVHWKATARKSEREMEIYKNLFYFACGVYVFLYILTMHFAIRKAEKDIEAMHAEGDR